MFSCLLCAAPIAHADTVVDCTTLDSSSATQAQIEECRNKRTISFTPVPGDVSVVFLGNIFGSVDGVLAGSGSQIIGEMFTVDPGKFVSGLARLASQARVARLLANDEFVKAVTGTGKAQTTTDKLKQMFFGSGAYGTLIAKVAMEGMGVRESDADQTERMLQNSSAASQSVQGMYGTTNP